MFKDKFDGTPSDLDNSDTAGSEYFNIPRLDVGTPDGEPDEEPDEDDNLFPDIDIENLPSSDADTDNTDGEDIPHEEPDEDDKGGAPDGDDDDIFPDINIEDAPSDDADDPEKDDLIPNDDDNFFPDIDIEDLPEEDDNLFPDVGEVGNEDISHEEPDEDDDGGTPDGDDDDLPTIDPIEDDDNLFPDINIDDMPSSDADTDDTDDTDEDDIPDENGDRDENFFPDIGIESINSDSGDGEPDPSDIPGNDDPFNPEPDEDDVPSTLPVYQFNVDKLTTEKHPPIPITTYDDGSKVVHIVEMFGCIYRFIDYIPLISLLESANSNTDIYIRISSPGGSVFIGSTIASAMANTKARVTTVCVGGAYSIAMFLWSAGHAQIVKEGSTFLFHMSSHGDWGNSSLIKSRAEDIIYFVCNYLLKVSLDKGHLTEEELERICNKSVDVVVTAKTMSERIGQGGAI